MTEAVNEASSTLAIAPRKSLSLRASQITRAAVLLIVGFAIAFTATLHENVATNRWMLAGAFTLAGLATLLEFTARRADRSSWPLVVRAAAMFLAGGALLATHEQGAAAIVIIAWAVVHALLVLLPALRDSAARASAVPAAILSLALAVAVLLFRDDPVALIGFFGGYAVIAGVFLGISAFDERAASPGAASAVEQNPSPSTGSAG